MGAKLAATKSPSNFPSKHFDLPMATERLKEFSGINEKVARPPPLLQAAQGQDRQGLYDAGVALLYAPEPADRRPGASGGEGGAGVCG